MDIQTLYDSLDELGAHRGRLLAAAFPAVRLVDGGGPIGWPDGWTPLVIRAVAALNAVAVASGTTVNLTDIKSKFGTVRIYAWPESSILGCSNPAFADVMRRAEDESALRCFHCGTERRFTKRPGVMAPRCADHWDGPGDVSGLDLSAHARLAVAARFGGGEGGWRAIRTDDVGTVHRLAVVAGGAACALTLSGAPGCGVLARAAVLGPAGAAPLDLGLSEMFALEQELAARAAEGLPRR